MVNLLQPGSNFPRHPAGQDAIHGIAGIGVLDREISSPI